MKTSFERSKKYIIFLLAYMMLYEFMDTYTTSYYQSVVSYIQAEFNMDDSAFYMVQAVGALGLLFVLLIQNFADIVGRKPMMIVVFFGMGFAAFILLIAPTTAVFTIGFFLTWVFFSSDIWIIVISEEAPAKKRGTYSYLIATVGAVGAIAIPICRTIFIGSVSPEENAAVWRGMTYPAVAAMGLALLGFWMKETATFKARKGQNKESDNLQKKRSKLRLPFQKPYRKAMLIFMAIGALLGLNAAVMGTYESYLTELIVTNNGGDPQVVTNIFFIASPGTLIFFAITGILADKIGRKILIYIYFTIIVGAFGTISIFGEKMAANHSYALFYLGFLFANGAFWGVFMLSKTYCVECFPTDIRGTAAGWRSFSYAMGLFMGSLVASALITVLSRDVMFISVLIFSGIVISALISKGLPETKGINIID